MEWIKNHKPLVFLVVTGLLPALIGLGTANSAAPAKKASHDDKVEELRTRLSLTKNELNTLNAKKSCDGDGDCEVVEMGWRHCGGPSEYMVISASNPNAKSIQGKIKEYTSLEREISLVDPPATCTEVPKLPQARCLKQECQAK